MGIATFPRREILQEPTGFGKGKMATSTPAPLELEGSFMANQCYSPRRASSVLLPSPMAPRIIPSEDLYILSPAVYRYTPEDEGLSPPKVPPKSPRTLHRTFDTLNSMSRCTSICSPATQSGSHTANSSVTSVESTDDHLPRASTAIKPRRLSRPASRSSAAPVRADHQSLLPWTMKEFNPIGLKKYREVASKEEQIPSAMPSAMPSATSAAVDAQPSMFNSAHQRGESDSSGGSRESIMNRGRPMCRGESAPLQHGLTRGCYHTSATSVSTFPIALSSFITSPPPVPEESAPLPIEHSRSRSEHTLGSTDLQSLRKDAQFQANTYEALTPTALAGLYKELTALTPRADRLHYTLKSLRTARTTLQDRVAIYLANTNGPISRDHLSRQQGALRELDLRIDERISSIDELEARRNLLQRKALEHAAAVLVVEVAPREHGLTTPPRSPERRSERSRESNIQHGAESEATQGRGSHRRQEVESIRVYADSGVASLLASIETEIGMMDPERRGIFWD